MMRAVNRPLQLAPEAFNGVRVTPTPHIFLSAMVNDFVTIPKLGHVVVGRIFVSVKLCAGRDDFADMLNRVSRVDDFDYLCADPATTISDADNGGLASSSSPAFAGLFPTDIALVSLAFTEEFGCSILHQLPDFMGHAPSRLVGYAKLTFKLFGSDPIPTGGHKEDAKKPEHERCSGFVEYRASRGIKLMPAPRTAVRTAFDDWVKTILFPALWASAAIGPAGLKEEIQAGALIGKISLKIK